MLWSQLSPVGLQRRRCEGNHRDLCWAVGEWRPLPTKQAWLPLLSACVHPPSPGPSRCFLHGVAVCPSPAVPEHHPCLITPQRALYKVVSAVPLSPQPCAFHHVFFFSPLGVCKMMFSTPAAPTPYLDHPLGHSVHLCHCCQAGRVPLGCPGWCHKSCRAWHTRAALRLSRSTSPTWSASCLPCWSTKGC